ncbi:MAG: carbon storage regulator [Janthinobacterium lividum]
MICAVEYSINSGIGYIMLVLTRRLNHRITLGNPASLEPPIGITVTGVRGDQMCLGIATPCSIPFHRKFVRTYGTGWPRNLGISYTA